MKKVKKTAAIILSMALLFTFLSIPALAANTEGAGIIVNGVDITVDPEEEISRAMAGISDLQMASVISSEAPATISSSNSSDPYNLHNTYTTVRKIETPRTCSASDSNGDIYAKTTVVVLSADKSNSDSKNKDYVTAYATVYWRDNFGMQNDFLGASGGWDRDVDPATGSRPSLSNRKVSIEAYDDASHTETEYFKPLSNTFEYSQSDFEKSAWKLILRTYVTIDSDAVLELAVASSMFT